MNNLQVGYNDILLIPQGATNIFIQERSPSNNYLAIRNLTGHYYLNGNYRIDFPRPMTFAGSLWTYERKPNGFAAPDKITCLGPIVEAVYLVVCLVNELKNVTFPQNIFLLFLLTPQSFYHKIKTLGSTTNTVSLAVQHCPMNLRFIHGHTQSLRHVRSHAAVDINLET